MWFLTPALVHAARSRRADERAFLYGSVFTANSASLILPGANLTNLIVLAHDHVPGTEFASRLWPAWAAAVLVTAAVVWLAFHQAATETEDGPPVSPARLGLGLVGVAGAAALVLALQRPALPVLALGILLVVLRRSRWRDLREAVNPLVLAGLFVLAVAVGTLARSWDGPATAADNAGGGAQAARAFPALTPA